MRIPSPWQGTLLILISAAGFGSNTILAKFAYASGANVPTMLFLRFFAASALLWLGMVVTGRSGFRLSGRALGACLGLGAVMYAAQSLTFFTALRFISASLVALLHYIYPAVVTLLAAAVLGERLDRWKVLALGMAGVGVLLVLGRGVGQAPSAGVTLALLSAGVYSGYIIISRQGKPDDNRRQLRCTRRPSYYRSGTSLQLCACMIATHLQSSPGSRQRHGSAARNVTDTRRTGKRHPSTDAPRSASTAACAAAHHASFVKVRNHFAQNVVFHLLPTSLMHSNRFLHFLHCATITLVAFYAVPDRAGKKKWPRCGSICCFQITRNASPTKLVPLYSVLPSPERIF